MASALARLATGHSGSLALRRPRPHVQIRWWSASPPTPLVTRRLRSSGFRVSDDRLWTHSFRWLSTTTDQKDKTATTPAKPTTTTLLPTNEDEFAFLASLIADRPNPPPREDVNKAYFPGKTFRSASKDVVFRAMAGNAAITTLKTLAWLKTGSSAMLSEAIHSLVDTGNQAILVLGLHQAAGVPDKHHQYGYGRAAYFWSLISALGIFWLGAGVTVTHGIQTLMSPPEQLHLSWEIWTVLGGSFLIDGWVLKRAVKEVLATKPEGVSLFHHIRRIKDPFMMAVLLEDFSACTGVIMAACGIGASHITGNPLWDSIASISIGALLGGVAVTLIRLNQKYLLGQSVEPEIEKGIRELLLARPSIDNVYAVQSQWVGPSTFSYKAEVDFDGTYLAARLLQMYKPVFLEAKDLENDLPLILAWYAEDVTRLVEKEVQEVEEEIRRYYPEAAFIELEPDSKDTEMRAIMAMKTTSSRTSEREAMARALANLARTLDRSADRDKIL
ncbi:hypothetical protein Poli38472_010246 [Pythium oligandrum]|uniref:Cation efflux protein transmembrane domain-containing protein n=1 Tax=Pythium oligandrum TaxID=41045 RepID=A0A8K1C8U4_PYTOL|nr:hypothetical protein Poli38472_010246 [Pythium oligandrum]|eukprot:TMW58687.1 hypothetical protein Poli38472_010246 [Pythium oligandrum]